MRLGLGVSGQAVLHRPVDAPFLLRPTRLRHRPVGGSWATATGTAMSVPGTNRIVHTVDITGLAADAAVEFQLLDLPTPAVYVSFSGDPTASVTVHWHTLQPAPTEDFTGVPFGGSVRKTRTLPAELGAEDTLRIAHLGDTHGREPVGAVLAAIAQRGARLLIHTGDMATGNGGEDVPSTWYQFCSDLTNYAVNPEGEIIPILAAIGNHEIWAGAAGTEWTAFGELGREVGVKPDFDTGKRGDAEWFYSFFPAHPGLRGFKTLDAGDYLSVITLDPGISTPLDDPSDSQVDWLAVTLAARQHVPHRIAALHYSPWPTGRRMMVPYYREMRSILGPVMQGGGVRLALVGHEHVLSRTVPINEWGELAHQVEHEADPDGIVFVGSGPSGASTQHGRNPHTKWWIHDSVATEWQHYDFEAEGLNPLGSPEYEPRPAHPADGTTFPDDEVGNWWEIDLTPDSRTVRAWHANGTMWDEFTQPADPAVP